MTIKSDIEIAQEAKPLPITDIADACGMDGAVSYTHLTLPTKA